MGKKEKKREKGKKGKKGKKREKRKKDKKIKMDQISHSEQSTAQTDQDRPEQTISVSISCSRTFLELRSSLKAVTYSYHISFSQKSIQGWIQHIFPGHR